MVSRSDKHVVPVLTSSNILNTENIIKLSIKSLEMDIIKFNSNLTYQSITLEFIYFIDDMIHASKFFIVHSPQSTNKQHIVPNIFYLKAICFQVLLLEGFTYN